MFSKLLCVHIEESKKKKRFIKEEDDYGDHNDDDGICVKKECGPVQDSSHAIYSLRKRPRTERENETKASKKQIVGKSCFIIFNNFFVLRWLGIIIFCSCCIILVTLMAIFSI